MNETPDDKKLRADVRRRLLAAHLVKMGKGGESGWPVNRRPYGANFELQEASTAAHFLNEDFTSVRRSSNFLEVFSCQLRAVRDR